MRMCPQLLLFQVSIYVGMEQAFALTPVLMFPKLTPQDTSEAVPRAGPEADEPAPDPASAGQGLSSPPWLGNQQGGSFWAVPDCTALSSRHPPPLTSPQRTGNGVKKTGQE
ncbi:hypothetical protein J0S82_001823 [Galemys pyrenaicus]|uniref:Uncharacterized protein n=1 Tax=Galemys pyrenaicus TaxID=202257 RepID=A0A8J6A3F7_GALPY|nr:hypothetical protein J0S82_001823 [Galemys pyrenaicus]